MTSYNRFWVILYPVQLVLGHPEADPPVVPVVAQVLVGVGHGDDEGVQVAVVLDPEGEIAVTISAPEISSGPIYCVPYKSAY